MANVGKLTVELQASVAKFQADLGRATAIAERNAKQINSVLSGIGATFGAAIGVGAFTSFIKGSIDAADALNDMSVKFGTTVENLAGLKLAADQSGTSLEGIAAGLKALSKELAGSPEEMRALGVTTKDSTEAMIQLADVFAAMPADADRTALSLKLFGKAGADMIPLLAGGSDELRRMIERGKELNPITTEAARAADRFNDAVGELKTAAGGAGTQLSQYFLPSLIDAAEGMRRAADEGKPLLALLHGIAGIGKLPWDAILPTQGQRAEIADINRQLAELEKKAAPLRNAVTSGKTKDPLGIVDIKLNKKSLDFATNQLSTLDKQMQILRDRAQQILKPQETGAPKPASHPALEAAGCIAAGGSFKDGKCVMPNRGGGGSRAGRSGRAAPKPDEPVDVFNNLSFIASKENADFIRQQFADVNDLQSDIQNSTSRANEELARQVERIKDMTDPLRPFRRELEEIGALYDSGLIGLEEWAAATESVREKMGSAFGRIKADGETAFDGISDAIGMAQSAFEEFTRTGKINFKDMLSSWAADAANNQFRALIPRLFGFLTGTQAPAPVEDRSFPAYATGTDYVPETGLALIHQGERIIPAAQNRPGYGGVVINTTINAPNATPGTLPQIQAMLDARDKRLKADILDSRRRGGAFS